jgi:hypothetical protein
VEFPSRRHLENWYASAEYAPALQVRDTTLRRSLTFHDGPAMRATRRHAIGNVVPIQ